MKQLFTIILFFAIANVYGQNITISDNASHTADASAMLDVYSQSKGMLVPKLTATQRLAISTPAEGLLVYDTDSSNFFFYSASSWHPISGAQYFKTNGDSVYITGNTMRFGVGTKSPKGRMVVVGASGAPTDEPLFEVKNSQGKSIFAVYENEVKVNFIEGTKGLKGGFAVGGLAPGKTDPTEYMRITPDSVRVYVKPDIAKGVKGGFAVGGLAPGKTTTGNILQVSPGNVQVMIDTSQAKNYKGGFAVGGLAPGKGDTINYMKINPGDINFKIDDSGAKGAKCGFAIGGLSPGKTATNFFNIAGSNSVDIINPSEPRILWYPKKNAFLTGQVLVQSVDSVGTNSMATGFESKAVGEYSQALGYQAIARGDYSTAIGHGALANNINSFALGEGANATGNQSYSIGRNSSVTSASAYAIGTEAEATGTGSYAIGSGYTSYHTRAKGDNAFAIGFGAQADSTFDLALGLRAIAGGRYSTAIGPWANAGGFRSVAIGYKATTSGDYSTAIGNQTSASGEDAFSAGFVNEASGYASVSLGSRCKSTASNSFSFGAYAEASRIYSVSMGSYTKAKGYYSFATGKSTTAVARSTFVLGEYNDTSSNYTYSYSNWYSLDPLFIIGNGTADNARSNAMTVLKSGRVGLQTVTSPTYALELPNSTTTGIGKARAYAWATYSDKRIKSDFEDIPYGLKEVLQLKPLKYNHHNSILKNGKINISKSSAKNIGLIAQDVYKIIPEVVQKPKDENKELWSMSYEKLVPVLIKAIQEQETQINNLKKEIEKLKDNK